MDFKVYKVRNNLTNKSIAEDLSLNRHYLSTILTGAQKPSAKLIKEIIEYTNGEVDANTFFKKELENARAKNHTVPRED